MDLNFTKNISTFDLTDSSNNNINTNIEEVKDDKEVKEEKSERSEPVDSPVDWKPQDKCYFCVDGKLLKVNESGELVVETGPVQPETELNKHVRKWKCQMPLKIYYTKISSTDYWIRRLIWRLGHDSEK